jgi:acetyl/propionyl-CoA carboxylase alpha subunit
LRYFVQVGSETVTLDVERRPDGSYLVRSADGQELSACSLAARAGLHTLSIDGQRLEVQPSEGEVRLAGQRFSVSAECERERVASRAVAGDTLAARSLTAPMPGRIVRVSCAAGQAVLKGASLVVIEAMKMQNELCAKADQVVRAVRVKSGDTVDRGAVLLDFE